MQRDPERLASGDFDVLVIGGGITGACVAHDAALRGLSVALVEKGDFGGATSAASSRLLHGGIRYLQQGRVDKLRESAIERAAFQTIAPHLTRYVPFVIPTYGGLARGRLALSAGVRLYDWLTAGPNRRIRDRAKQVPRSSRYSAADLHRVVGAVAGGSAPTGAQVIHESQMYSSERMTLAFVKSAASRGAAVANYVGARTLLRTGGRVAGAAVRDELSGREFEVAARLTVNAAGPWMGRVDGGIAGGSLDRRITGFSRGAHIVTRSLFDDVAIALPTRRQARAVVTRGGRHVFVMPWRGHSLIGTSDHPFEGTPDDVRPTARDVTDLIDDVTRALPGAEIGPEDVRYAFAGLYPLTDDALKADVYQGTGDYQIVDHARRDGVEGCLSVLGAKFTTARRVAERAVDVALEKLKRPAVPCRTSDTPLAGGEISDLAGFEEAVARKWPDMDGALARHLVSAYGTEIDDLLAVCREQTGWRRLAPERAAIEGEVHFAVDREMAVRLEDVIFRRTGLGTLGHPGDGCLRRCADIIGIRLGWTADRVADEIRRTELLFAVGSPAVRSPGR